TPAILLPPLIGESSYCLWLLIKGVDVAKWNERMSLATGSNVRPDRALSDADKDNVTSWGTR
ncbi:MAG: hypothetical protein QOD95_2436, partial [Gammaproteobacteria bacterium]|nr:hypothetical protein [Gammaproteobacteria bacterium]